jgi:hypothetical protein
MEKLFKFNAPPPFRRVYAKFSQSKFVVVHFFISSPPPHFIFENSAKRIDAE